MLVPEQALRGLVTLEVCPSNALAAVLPQFLSPREGIVRAKMRGVRRPSAEQLARAIRQVSGEINLQAAE